LANKQIKVLLTQAAKCAVRHNPNIRDYYQRKIVDGRGWRYCLITPQLPYYHFLCSANQILFIYLQKNCKSKNENIKLVTLFETNPDELMALWLSDRIYELVKEEKVAVNSLEIVINKLI
jgi:hypothetical protein